MKVLEDEHERPLVRQRLEVASPGREALALRRRVVVPAGKPDEASQPCRHPVGLARVGGHFLHRSRQLARDLLVGVGLENPGLRLDDLGERPEADALAVRK